MSDGRVRYARKGDARLAYRVWGESDTTMVFVVGGMVASIDILDGPTSPYVPWTRSCQRAGAWSTNRDLAAARPNWQRACQVPDRLPPEAIWIAPRALLCGSAWRAGGSVADTGFDELRDLCTAAGDQRSLAIAMADC